MLIPAIKLGILYAVLSFIEKLLGWQCFSRPLTICPITGLLLGNLQMGCIMGAALESIYMGISFIGGAAAADPTSASFLITALVILTGTDVESAMSLAIPVGTIMLRVSHLPEDIWTPFQPLAIAAAEEGNIRRLGFFNYLFGILTAVIGGIGMFACVYIGVDAMDTILQALPAWILNGLSAAGSLSMAVGLSILLSMIWSSEVSVWFFVGYVLVKYFGITDTLAIAILGLAVAVMYFFLEKKAVDSKEVKQEEDFL